MPASQEPEQMFVISPPGSNQQSATLRSALHQVGVPYRRGRCGISEWKASR
jgi:hypothetical protein